MKAYLLDLNQIYLEWNLGVSGSLFLDRAETDEPSAYQQVADVTGVLFYKDKIPNRYTRLRHWYYRLRGDDGGIKGKARVEGYKDDYGHNAAWLAKRHLKRDIRQQTLAFVLPKKGNRCTECWDDIKKARIKSNCGTCDGSGFMSGYHTPQPCYVSYASNVGQPEQWPIGNILVTDVEAWTANYPILHEGDILLRDYDKALFEVMIWRPTVKAQWMVRQVLLLRKLDPNDGRRKIINQTVTAYVNSNSEIGSESNIWAIGNVS